MSQTCAEGVSDGFAEGSLKGTIETTRSGLPVTVTYSADFRVIVE